MIKIAVPQITVAAFSLNSGIVPSNPNYEHRVQIENSRRSPLILYEIDNKQTIFTRLRATFT